MGLFLFYLFFMCIFLKLLVLIHLKIDNNSVGKHMIGIRNCVHLASIPCSLFKRKSFRQPVTTKSDIVGSLQELLIGSSM